jgi:uncharacterized protein YsxB (DUF464 family)
MILVEFTGAGDALSGVNLTGHADYADAGEDIVCAAVTSAVQMTANGITEILKIPLPLTVEENLISFTLPQEVDTTARAFLLALRLHLEILSQQYENTIAITEV